MPARGSNSFGRKIAFIFVKIARRVLKVVGKHYLFVSFKGIKSINSQLNLPPLDRYPIRKLSSKQLFLFIDGLPNESTLADVSIIDSPHYQLISRVTEGKYFMDCSYVIRAENGTLDMRFPTFYTEQYYQDRHAQLIEGINGSKKGPVLVFQFGEKYYLLDGKHRAAYFAIQKEAIEAKVINSLKGNTFLEDVYQKMLKNNPKRFSKNLDLLKIALEKEEINNK